jgi:hypothetical protein
MLSYCGGKEKGDVMECGVVFVAREKVLARGHVMFGMCCASFS